VFEARLQTYWDDADPAGRLYFANFFRFVEYAETELFRSAGAERMQLYDEFDVWMPRVESFARFEKPIMAEEAIRVSLRTQFKGEKTVRIDFEILSNEERTLLATGYLVAVCIDRKSQKSRPLPARMREILARAAVTDNEDPSI
jgi:acyl-CoA thioester hydrolase